MYNKAVYEYADLMRASIASAGNDHRLGANEAPPAIMSVFIGEQLTSVLDELEKSGSIRIQKGDNMYMKLGIDKIPEILLDNTDRNRTSPFAFTGNKFEFRAVGGSTNVAAPMTILNLIVADQLKEFRKDVDKKIGEGENMNLAILSTLQHYIRESESILFEGNNYSDEWANEAEKRSLPNLKTTPIALDAYDSLSTKELFGRLGVLNETELSARHEIMLEAYTNKLQIESRFNR